MNIFFFSQEYRAVLKIEKKLDYTALYCTIKLHVICKNKKN